MARPEVQKSVDSWFDASTREGEHAWVERLEEVVPLYMEMGYTKGEAAILFSLGHILMQISKVHSILHAWDEEDSGDAPR